jgi:hypothetical protein
MSLEERLNAIGIDDSNTTVIAKPMTGSQFIPKTDNLLVLLVQGLQSNDSKTLNVCTLAFKNYFPIFSVGNH